MRDPDLALRLPGAAVSRAHAGLVCVILAAAFVVACGGDNGDPVEAPRPVSATAERQRMDGFATVQSRITVEFPTEISLVLDGDALFAAITVRSAGVNAQFRPTDFPIASIAVSREDPKLLLIDTAALVDEGAELRIGRAALVDGAEGSVAVRVSADLSPVNVLAASLPLIPTAPELFGEAGIPPVLSSDRDQAAVREAFAEHLEARGSGAESTARALERFDGMDPNVVTSPKIAAALASLTGTFAEPAIDNLLTAANCTGQPVVRIAFEPPPELPDLVARVTHTDTGARIISLNPALEGELFQLLAPVLAHEAIHCDEEDSLSEEVVATAFDAFLYLHYVAAEPSLAQEPTQLAHNYNSDALAMLNSGSVVPETVGILASPGDFTVLQGSDAPYRSFAEYVVAAYEDLTTPISPSEELALAYAANLAAIHDSEPRDPFDLDYLDALLGLTLPVPAMASATGALGLDFIP